MKISFLGTNGWYDTATGNTSCVLAETDAHYIIFDAGSGFQKARDIITSDKPVFLFISHLHLDHLFGLHTLPLFRIAQGIDIYAPRNAVKLLHGFLKRPFTSPPFLLNTKLRFHALEGRERFPFDFEMRKLRHAVPCYGYRIGFRGRTIAYCTDTGECRNLGRLASEADLLITECAMAPGDKSRNLFHLTPEAAAKAALNASAKKLALFHFDPGKYPAFENRKKAEDSAKKIFPGTIAANDGTEITI
ncbi:MAG: ribonuclease Z [Candidatus Omnitrophica bacterium]|nr:ribonuclease Z [Candidatus Omnitrophota bacterium]